MSTTAANKLKARTLKEVSAVFKLEKQAAAGAIIAGFNLHRTKASLPHGKFVPFLEKELAAAGGWSAGTATKNASFYMRLATAFYEKAGLKQVDVITALDGNKTTGKALRASLEKFVGDQSLTELLIKHGIKGVGLKTALGNGDDDQGGGDGDLTPAQKAEQARTQAWEESWTSTQRLRAAFSEPEKLQLLDDPKQLETLKAELVAINKLADERITALRSAKSAA
ncbi:MAG: hypothetical protein WC700_19355 [Gemmatimonadaceae bacterium]